MKTNHIIKFAAFLFAAACFFGCKPESEKLGTIYGTVTDFATGEPVGNANVKLRPNGNTTLTGSDGAYEFKELEAGKYSLLISKVEYADLDDDYIIELQAGKEMKRDVQLRKRVASLKITDMEGNPLDTLDFGDQESVKVKTFNVFNDGTETLTCTVTYDCEWITNVSGLENQVQSGQTAPVTVRIDRVALADGDNTTFLYITSANGSNEIVIKATFKGTVVINTKNATDVGSSSATVGGIITDDGGRPVTGRGVCYGTSQSPDINGLHTEDGSDTGEFSHNITGLNASTTYYARAYATNSNGTYYASNIVSFTTTDGLPTVITDSVTNITSTTAKCGGNVTNNGGHNVTARGICWNTMGSPDLNDQHTTNGYGNGTFISNMTDLDVGVTYYVRAYASNSQGTSYGDEMVFTTNDGSITVTTNEVTEITTTTAMCGGNVTVSAGNSFPITARGVCWSTTHNPTITGNHTSDGTGVGQFTSSITDLSLNTTYYVRAYATNQLDTYYGEEKTFTTNDGSITVTTNDVSNITPTTAMCGGNITVPAGNSFPITARGVCWSTTHNPTITGNHTSDGTGAGQFTSSITGLSVNTTYYVRAYATNEVDTYYGDEKCFSTTVGLPVVTTKNVTNIAPLSATCGGIVTSDNGFPVTSRGICWSTVSNPTIDDYHTTNGTGTGEYNSLMENLQNSTTYHVRAYATNANGTAYGEDKIFTTTSGAITVTTNNVTGVGPTSATCGGNASVTTDNNLPITAKGVCWGTGHNPTISGSHTTDGMGPGAFTSSITGLSVNTIYYVRAYATNQLETYYGSEKPFTTTDGQPIVSLDVNSFAFVSSTSVSCTSNVSSDGGLAINSKGMCWGTVPNPTIANNHTNEGGGTGYYTSVLTNLDENSTYYVRAYATNSAGTSYSEQFVLTADYRAYLGFPRMQYNGSTYVIYPDLGSVMNFETAWAECGNLTYGGFSDWFMPNINELYAMYLNRESIGGFNTNTLNVLYYGEAEGPYWSSSFSSCSVYEREFCCFGTGVIGCASETISGVQMYVRPVRKIE